MSGPQTRSVQTAILEIVYEEWGPVRGSPVILLHGFPDDVHAWRDVASHLADEGHRVLVPYLRGYGPTRFLSPSTPRSGQQAALGQDVIDFMDAMHMTEAVLAGYDWGCTAACAASVLQPKRVRALLAIHGYGIGNTKAPEPPAPPEEERECWYHWYFNIERGRRGLEANRRELCLLLWRSWSPSWQFSMETFERTARSFDNPDFVSVVIHGYRHSHGNLVGDPALEETERFLAKLPAIKVSSMVLHGAEDTVHPLHRSEPTMHLFPRGTERRVVQRAGHFVPRERPDEVCAALDSLLARG
ncbi:MAG: alpha/beta hydrolase [Spirochaetia bacterium]|jgi:pimeloyl-ACP methyl ester carboxylesterase